MDAQFKSALQAICAGDSAAVLVTIIRVKGSTPRKPGAKMLVLPDGQVFGTVGGGCGEAEVRREALNVLTGQISRTYTVNMTNNMAEDEGMVCGGIMEVLIEFLDPAAKKLLAGYLTALEKGAAPVLVTVAGSTDPVGVPLGRKLYFTRDGVEKGDLGADGMNQIARQWGERVLSERKPQVLNIGADFTVLAEKTPDPAYQLYFELHPAPVELLILGAGHIALPLAAMAKMTGYHVTVIDDRPAFANSARFANADRVICDDFLAALNGVGITPQTFVVIVTRGHRHDKVCLRAVINCPAGYIGMIGSRRRVKALLADLAEEGIPEERLNTVQSPIGLDIGAETPEEIAVSILAELIKVHRGGRAQSLKLVNWK